MKKNIPEIIKHISRLEGQLAATKRELMQQSIDCKKAAETLRAASRSFSSLKASFVLCFLSEKLVGKKEDPDMPALINLING
jgi:DNA-binding FrmR family transcriptional regulator